MSSIAPPSNTRRQGITTDSCILSQAREELILATHDAATELETRLRQSIPTPPPLLQA